MDFICICKGDLVMTESLYGKNSEQYKMSLVLNRASEILTSTNRLELRKECAQEDIVHTFTYIPTVPIVSKHIKKYYDKNGNLKRIKEKKINTNIKLFVSGELFKLIFEQGYQIIEEKEN